MTQAIFITVRTGSTRLPNKSLLKIQGLTTIEHVIQRVKRSRLAQQVVLCTTTLPEDDVLAELATKNGIQFYRGPVEDKLERWNGAAQKFGVDFFVTADGDDLLCEPELIDLAFAQAKRTGADFIEGQGQICGSFTYGIRASALKKVCEIKAEGDTEMMWVYFKDTGLFRVELLQDIPADFKRGDIRMTLDYAEDFEFFKRVIEALQPQKPDFNLHDVVRYIDQHPEVAEINIAFEKMWAENQKKKTTLRLKPQYQHLLNPAGGSL